MVWPLALAQLISWGCLYYSFALLVVPLEQDYGWSKEHLNLALTVALINLAVATYPMGKLLDRVGGRLPMSVAAAIAAGLLGLISYVESLPMFIFLWGALGFCMSALLYEPAFAVVNQLFKSEAKRGITAITLVAGFASTVFVPFTELAIASIGWRDTIRALASLMLFVVLPIHLVFIPSFGPRKIVRATAHNAFEIATLFRSPLFLAVCIWATSQSFVFVGLFFQLVPWLKDIGVNSVTIVSAIAVMGPMQVLGRLLVMVFGKNASLRRLGIFTTSIFPIVLAMLIFLPKNLLFLSIAIGLFGLANGITTILRGAIPNEWFDSEHYAKTAGAIAVPAIIVGALAPLILSLVWVNFDVSEMFLWCFIATLVCAAAFHFASWWQLKDKRGCSTLG